MKRRVIGPLAATAASLMVSGCSFSLSSMLDDMVGWFGGEDEVVTSAAPARGSPRLSAPETSVRGRDGSATGPAPAAPAPEPRVMVSDRHKCMRDDQILLLTQEFCDRVGGTMVTTGPITDTLAPTTDGRATDETLARPGDYQPDSYKAALPGHLMARPLLGPVDPILSTAPTSPQGSARAPESTPMASPPVAPPTTTVSRPYRVLTAPDTQPDVEVSPAPTAPVLAVPSPESPPARDAETVSDPGRWSTALDRHGSSMGLGGAPGHSSGTGLFRGFGAGQ